MSKKPIDPDEIDRRAARAEAKAEVAGYAGGVRSKLSPKDREYYDREANSAIQQIDESSKRK